MTSHISISDNIYFADKLILTHYNLPYKAPSICLSVLFALLQCSLTITKKCFRITFYSEEEDPLLR
jgi:hypothetical protein